MQINLTCVGSRFNTYRNLVRLLYLSLCDLGHDVRVSENRLELGAFNLILPPMAFRSTELLDALTDRGVDYGVVGIETFDGYDHRISPDADADDTQFRRFLNHARAVFCLFAKDLPAYQGLTRRVIATRYGFHAGVREIPTLKERPVDVFFFGDVDPYPRRRRILDALRDAGLVVDILAGSTAAPNALVRNARIARAKINLNINHTDHASPQRLIYLANNAHRPISDGAEDLDGYLEVARLAENDSLLIDLCQSVVATGSWRTDGEAAYAIAERWPMSETLANCLDLAFAP